MDTKYIFSEIEQRINKYHQKVKIERTGRIETIADGVSKIIGLYDVSSGELLEFPHSIYGLALNLEEDRIGAIILGDYLKLSEGDAVKGTGRLLSIPVGENFMGRVIDPLGRPLDEKGEIKALALGASVAAVAGQTIPAS